MKPYKLLIVDDEWNMRNLIKIYLKKENVQLTEARNGKEALSFIEKNGFDLILLDIMMPDMSGWEVCKEVRKARDIPILMLTARTDVKDIVRGLNGGADDYLTKPFAPEELIARVNALLRRTKKMDKANANRSLSFKDLTIDFESRTVLVNGEPAGLTPKEFELLYLLATHPKRVYTRDMLIERIWGPEHFRDDRTVDTHVKNIREKIRNKNLSYDPIQTVWGVGYQFERIETEE
ncbi:DNA-binding response regulator [Pueribacillus theae]|uniref:DNA-binding response regulator n=1 Tax=Pueribacillus theae TaxID=2171751 RepID=A0A2U1K555_9BACI|nr:response regulator transcription factor [Pueribacillus theae]PWA12512.1 DNA-binding response regulator [Pueribacillus theae]